MHSFSFGELALIFGIIIVLFGGSRLASIGKSLGEGIANFKKGINAGGVSGEEKQNQNPPLAATPHSPPQITSHVQEHHEHVVDVTSKDSSKTAL